MLSWRRRLNLFQTRLCRSSQWKRSGRHIRCSRRPLPSHPRSHLPTVPIFADVQIANWLWLIIGWLWLMVVDYGLIDVDCWFLACTGVVQVIFIPRTEPSLCWLSTIIRNRKSTAISNRNDLPVLPLTTTWFDSSQAQIRNLVIERLGKWKHKICTQENLKGSPTSTREEECEPWPHVLQDWKINLRCYTLPQTETIQTTMTWIWNVNIQCATSLV